jgi:hypothetical protein
MALSQKTEGTERRKGTGNEKKITITQINSEENLFGFLKAPKQPKRPFGQTAPFAKPIKNSGKA